MVDGDNSSGGVGAVGTGVAVVVTPERFFALALVLVLVETNPVLPAPRPAGNTKLGICPTGSVGALRVRRTGVTGRVAGSNSSNVVRMPDAAVGACAATCVAISPNDSAPKPISARHAEPRRNKTISFGAAGEASPRPFAFG